MGKLIRVDFKKKDQITDFEYSEGRAIETYSGYQQSRDRYNADITTPWVLRLIAVLTILALSMLVI